MIEQNIATISDNSNRIRIFFLVQNIAFAANFSKILKSTEFIQKNNLDSKSSLKLHREIMFSEDKLNHICEKIKEFDFYKYVNFSNTSTKKTLRFPANIIRCEFHRSKSNLSSFKSLASIKRQLASKELQKKEKNLLNIKTLFDTQNCSFSVFTNGLVNCTGATTRKDAKKILCILRLFNSFLPSVS